MSRAHRPASIGSIQSRARSRRLTPQDWSFRRRGEQALACRSAYQPAARCWSSRAMQDSATAKPRARSDWWKVEHGRPPTNLTGGMPAVPSALFAERGSNAFVGVAGGDLFRIGVAEGTAQNLTEAFEPAINSIAWPMRALAGEAERVIVRVAREATSDFYEVNLKSSQPRLIAKPSGTASLADFVPKSQMAVFSAND